MTSTIMMLLGVPIMSELSTIMDEQKKESFTKEEIIGMFGKAIVNAGKRLDEKEEDRKKEKSEPSPDEMACKSDFHQKSEF